MMQAFWRNKPKAVGVQPRLLRFARNDGGYDVVKRQRLSLRGARSATKQSYRRPRASRSRFGETIPRNACQNESEDSFWQNEPKAFGGRMTSSPIRCITKPNMTDALKPRDAKDVEDAVRWALAEGKTLEVVGQGTKRALGRPRQSDLTLDLSGLVRHHAV